MYYVEERETEVIFRDEEEHRQARIPRRNYMGMYQTGNPPSLEREKYREKILIPVENGGERLSEIVREKQAKNVCVIISDATRGVPTKQILPFLLEELKLGGIQEEQIIFMIALGVHRAATPDEMKTFIGEELFKKARIENHNAFDEKKLVYLGKTSRGTPVKVNRTVYESDLVITIGKVELHDMAGFSGGRKSILPGVSSEETILINHRPQMIEDLNSRAGNLKDNPIHEDMLEAAKMCGTDYCVNLVMNQKQEIAGIFSGELQSSHEAAADFLKSFCRVSIEKRPDIYLVCPGSPLNIDLYQGIKALIGIHTLIQENATVILYGDFREGINSKDFFTPFQLCPTLEQLEQYVWENYEIQMDHIIPFMKILKKSPRILVVSENVEKENLEQMHMEKAADLQTAVEEAISKSGKKVPQIAICPQSYRCIFEIEEK